MTTLDDAVALAAAENGLAVVSTLRADGTIQASLVNAGVLPHPGERRPALAFVTYGRVKLRELAGPSAAGGDVPHRMAMGDRGGSSGARGPRRSAALAGRRRPAAAAAA